MKSTWSIIYLRENKYCKRTSKKNKILYNELDPQPRADEVISIIRVICSHQLDANFIRRTSTVIDSSNEKVNNITLFQYSGKQPENVRKQRTNPKTMQRIKQRRHENTKQIYHDEIADVTNFKVISNMKYREKKANEGTNTKSTVDDIESLVENVGDGFIRFCFYIEGDLPAFVLFSNDQILDMASSAKHVSIGIDRTFNLGPHFLTMFTFKNPKVIRTITNENPIFMGPMLLHKKATKEVFILFFTFIKARIGSMKEIDINLGEQTVIGSDEELAITGKTYF